MAPEVRHVPKIEGQPQIDELGGGAGLCSCGFGNGRSSLRRGGGHGKLLGELVRSHDPETHGPALGKHLDEGAGFVELELVSKI